MTSDIPGGGGPDDLRLNSRKHTATSIPHRLVHYDEDSSMEDVYEVKDLGGQLPK